jgi:hypothetical protein
MQAFVVEKFQGEVNAILCQNSSISICRGRFIVMAKTLIEVAWLEHRFQREALRPRSAFSCFFELVLVVVAKASIRRPTSLVQGRTLIHRGPYHTKKRDGWFCATLYLNPLPFHNSVFYLIPKSYGGELIPCQLTQAPGFFLRSYLLARTKAGCYQGMPFWPFPSHLSESIKTFTALCVSIVGIRAQIFDNSVPALFCPCFLCPALKVRIRRNRFRHEQHCAST